MSNGITMVAGLPEHPPFVPQVDCRVNIAPYLKTITGMLMHRVQSHAPANFLIQHFHSLVGQNGFNNPAFIQLVQDSVIVLDYVVSNTPIEITGAIQEYIPVLVNGASASYATKTQLLNTPQITNDLRNMAMSSANEFNQLLQQSKNWYQGANMYAPTYPQQQGYPMQPQQPGYPMQPGFQMQPGYPPQGYPQGYPMQPGYGQPNMMPNGQPAYANMNAMRPAAPMINPNAMVNGYQGQNGMMYPQQQPPGYQNQQTYPGQPGYSQPSSGPRAGGITTGIPGTNVGQPTQQNNYVPTAAVAQSYNNQPPAHTPAQPAYANVNHNAPVNKPQPVHEAVQAPVATATPYVPNEDTVYRVPDNSGGVVRLPYLYDMTCEEHIVKVDSNNVVISQSIKYVGEKMNLSDHDTRPYFRTRTKADLVNPNLQLFTSALEKATSTLTAKELMTQLAELTNEDEESLNRETAVIVRNALSSNLLVVDTVFCKPTQHEVTPHHQYKSIVDSSIAARLDTTTATFRSVKYNTYALMGEQARLASAITTSENLYDLHRLLTALVDSMEPAIQSPFVDWITDFVLVETQRYYGLLYSIDSFITDMQPMLNAMLEDEGEDFVKLYVERLHYRLTTTILYAYTPAELNDVCRSPIADEDEVRYFAQVDQMVLLPTRSRDIPYTYNGKAGLILNTEYRSLTRLIETTLEYGGNHLATLKLVTLDGDVLNIHPIINDGSYVLYSA